MGRFPRMVRKLRIEYPGLTGRSSSWRCGCGPRRPSRWGGLPPGCRWGRAWAC